MSQSVSAYAASQPPSLAKPAADRASLDAPRFDEALLTAVGDGPAMTPGPKLYWTDALLQDSRGRAPRGRGHPDDEPEAGRALDPLLFPIAAEPAVAAEIESDAGDPATEQEAGPVLPAAGAPLPASAAALLAFAAVPADGRLPSAPLSGLQLAPSRPNLLAIPPGVGWTHSPTDADATRSVALAPVLQHGVNLEAAGAGAVPIPVHPVAAQPAVATAPAPVPALPPALPKAGNAGTGGVDPAQSPGRPTFVPATGDAGITAAGVTQAPAPTPANDAGFPLHRLNVPPVPSDAGKAAAPMQVRAGGIGLPVMPAALRQAISAAMDGLVVRPASRPAATPVALASAAMTDPAPIPAPAGAADTILPSQAPDAAGAAEATRPVPAGPTGQDARLAAPEADTILPFKAPDAAGTAEATRPVPAGPVLTGVGPLGQGVRLAAPPAAPAHEREGGEIAVSDAPTDSALAATTGTASPQASHAAAVHRPLPAEASPAPTVADQVAPAVLSMVGNPGAWRRLSISITPEELGQVSITVERAVDGTTAIHVAAERLATLDLLRRDQADLARALDQAGVGQGSHSLSFSLNDGGGRTPGREGRDGPPAEHRPATAAQFYADAPVSGAAALAAARGGIDVTA